LTLDHSYTNTPGTRFSASLAVQKYDEDSSGLQSKVDTAHNEVIQMGRAIDKYGTVTTNNNTLLQRLSNMMSRWVKIRTSLWLRAKFSSCLTLQLNSLIDMANKIWNTNLQIMAIVTKLQSSPPKPNISYTWFQEPIRFEDALGRIIPIPSEYSWSVSLLKLLNV
jgi:hypothetical protein